MAKRIAFDRIGSSLVWAFSTGQRASIDVGRLSADIQERAMYHGVKQKCADSMAIEHKRPDGTSRPPTDAEKYDSIMKVIGNLYDGRWSGAREATGGLLYQAFAILKPGRFETVLEFQEWLETEAKERELTPKQFAAKLETQPGQIKDTVDRLREEMAGEGEVDSEDVLENL